MSKKSLLTLFLLAVGLFTFTRPTPAQTSAGNITGIVTDESMAVVPNAKLTVTNQATGLKRETFTNSVGEYRVPLLPVGFYTIRIEVSGFKAQISKGIKLEIQQTARVDFKLELRRRAGNGHRGIPGSSARHRNDGNRNRHQARAGDQSAFERSSIHADGVPLSICHSGFPRFPLH